MLLLLISLLDFAAAQPPVGGRLLWAPNVSGNLNQMNPKAGTLE
jgi:hypothetical protein